MEFRLETERLAPIALTAPSAGGFVSFEGKVRNEHHGRPVVALEYEAYDAMAIQEGVKLLQEAIERFGLSDATCAHRVGKLTVGEVAVVIAVAAPHRKAAFQGCEFIIDELKRRVPIWKREIYADGDSGWIGANDDVIPI